MRRVSVPESGPPFDDELPAGELAGRRDPALARPAASTQGWDPVPPGRPQARRTAAGPAGPGRAAPGTGPAGPRRAVAADAAAWPGQFARVLAETLAGSRPARQLTPWTTEQARRRIRQLGPMLAAGQAAPARRAMPAVRRVLTCSPAPGVVEMSAVLIFDGRVRALAIRLERGQRPGQPWVCTAIEAA